MRIRASVWRRRRHPAPPQGGPRRQRAGLLHAGRAPADAGGAGRQAPRPLGRHRHRVCARGLLRQVRQGRSSLRPRRAATPILWQSCRASRRPLRPGTRPSARLSEASTGAPLPRRSSSTPRRDSPSSGSGRQGLPAGRQGCPAPLRALSADLRRCQALPCRQDLLCRARQARHAKAMSEGTSSSLIDEGAVEAPTCTPGSRPTWQALPA